MHVGRAAGQVLSRVAARAGIVPATSPRSQTLPAALLNLRHYARVQPRWQVRRSGLMCQGDTGTVVFLLIFLPRVVRPDTGNSDLKSSINTF